jgi:hypothetical protein
MGVIVMSKKNKDRNESPNRKGRGSESSNESPNGKGGKGRRSGNESHNGKGGRGGFESPNRKGRGGSESPNGKGRGGFESPNGNGLGSNGDLGSLIEKKLRKKAFGNGTSTPVAGANGTGIVGAVEALRAILDPGLSQKKSKKCSKKTSKKSKECNNNSESCWE